MEDLEAVKYEVRGRVAHVILNRADKLNAINLELKHGLDNVLQKIEVSKDLRVVILRGMGKAFCAGGDLSAIRRHDGMGRVKDLKYSQSLLKRILGLEQVVIAAVHGYAIGAGFNLAMAADLVYAAEGTKFGQAFVKVGLTPDWGGMYFLPLLGGVRWAKECFLFGENIDAKIALAHGVINGIFHEEELLNQVEDRAQRLAAGPWNSIHLIKQIVDKVQPKGLQAVFDAEIQAFKQCAQSPDFVEGLNAFLERRKPRFQ